jgi:hypothetical protein
MILETCCEGGPMGGDCDRTAHGDDPEAAPPARPESSDDFSRG